jgi:hypothetical protein
LAKCQGRISRGTTLIPAMPALDVVNADHAFKPQTKLRFESSQARSRTIAETRTNRFVSEESGSATTLVHRFEHDYITFPASCKILFDESVFKDQVRI